MEGSQEKLRAYTEKMDRIDDEILEKLKEKMEAAGEIAKIRKELGMPLVDLIAERKRLDQITENSQEDMRVYNRLVYNAISELGKDYQRKITQEETPLMRAIEEAREKTPKVFPRSASVACQGVQGAYSQQACDKIFKMPRIMYMRNFEGVFAAIDQGLCKYGVLPLENSTAGSVNQIYDLLMKYNCYIVRGTKIKVDHSLLAKPGVKKEDIKEIVSHEQAIMQCETYLKNFPKAKITVQENTAASAKMVAESGRRDIAALASYECGQLYGLVCLDEAVQDSGDNYTRFIVISKEPEIYPGADKTSMLLTVSHKPGSLYNVLARFYALGINIVKLESRPIPGRDFDFMFYLDIEAETYAEEFVRLMNQVEELSQEFKYLGSYSEIG